MRKEYQSGTKAGSLAAEKTSSISSQSRNRKKGKPISSGRQSVGRAFSDRNKTRPVHRASPESSLRDSIRSADDGCFSGCYSESVEEQNYVLIGRNPIREALKNHRDFEKLLVQKGELSGSAKEIVKTAKDRKINVQIVDKARLDEISTHHQGLIAFASAYQYSSVEEILQTAKERNEYPFIVLLDGITDPHNFGAIIRTAECAGVHGIIIPQHRSVGLSPAAVKASAGAIEYVKIARVPNLNRAIDDLKKRGIWIYAVTMNGEDYEKVSFSHGVGLIIGSEGDGISRLTAKTCDQSVSIPILGRIDSLNASVAAGIMIYKVVSSRSKP